MRQEKGHAGNAELCSLYSQQPTQAGKEHFFVSFTFADYGTEAGTLRIDGRMLLQKTSARLFEKQVPIHRDRWRELSVEIGPDRLRARWEGEWVFECNRARLD